MEDCYLPKADKNIFPNLIIPGLYLGS